MNLSEWIKQTYVEDKFLCRPRIYCNDGFHMSVQGSFCAYCCPRRSSDWYDQMEIGFPSEREELIMPFAETPENPTGTVYGYVPVGIIQDVINKHGGIDVAKTMKGVR